MEELLAGWHHSRMRTVSRCPLGQSRPVSVWRMWRDHRRGSEPAGTDSMPCSGRRSLSLPRASRQGAGRGLADGGVRLSPPGRKNPTGRLQKGSPFPLRRRPGTRLVSPFSRRGHRSNGHAACPAETILGRRAPSCRNKWFLAHVNRSFRGWPLRCIQVQHGAGRGRPEHHRGRRRRMRSRNARDRADRRGPFGSSHRLRE